MKKAALYIRVSTDAQREEGYSIDAQKDMLKGYCASKGIKEYEFYIDGGFSGSNIDRPRLSVLIDDIKAGKISAVIVYKLDRLSRSQKDTLYLIEDVLNPNGTSFISINENMDTSTPIGRAMLGIMSAFAQLERETIRERTRMGMMERVRSGLWPGGGKIPFGYDYCRETGKLVPNKDADTVRRVYELYLSGYSALAIASITGLKYERLALQILKRLSNTGCTVYKGEVIENTHQGIISKETYEFAMEEMKRRSKASTGDAKYLLAGLVFCGVCGRRMRYQKWSGGKRKIYCYSQDISKSRQSGCTCCDNIKTDADELEKAVLDDLFSMKSEGSESADQELLPELERRLSGEKRRLKRLYLLYASADDDTLLEAIDGAKRSVTAAEEAVAEYKEKGQRIRKVMNKIKKLNTVKDTFESMNGTQKRAVLRELIDRIVITYDNVDIYYSQSIRFQEETALKSEGGTRQKASS